MPFIISFGAGQQSSTCTEPLAHQQPREVSSCTFRSNIHLFLRFSRHRSSRNMWYTHAKHRLVHAAGLPDEHDASGHTFGISAPITAALNGSSTSNQYSTVNSFDTAAARSGGNSRNTTNASSGNDAGSQRTTLRPSRSDAVTSLCDNGMPDPEMCDILDTPPPQVSMWSEALTRGRWLLGLLILQSTSSFVLDNYQDLLRDHLVVTLFLTMLVGAGGNAGNQSAIKVIRGLATGSLNSSWRSAVNTMQEQAGVGAVLGAGLSAGGFARVYMTNGDVVSASAISVSLFLIVITSVLLGSGLPFALSKLGVDPANAGTSIQVLMDILGVAITCATCNFVLVQLAHSVSATGG